MTENWYHGNERAFLISNCIFRVGGSAVILSNRRADKRRSMFKLEHIIRTHMGKDDEAYDSVVQDLVRRTASSLTAAPTGPCLTLPRELLLCVVCVVCFRTRRTARACGCRRRSWWWLVTRCGPT